MKGHTVSNLDLNKPLITRDGQPVKFLTQVNANAGSVEYLFLITYETGNQEPTTRDASGRVRPDGDDHPADVINVPDIRVAWVNIYGMEDAVLGRACMNPEQAERERACRRTISVGDAPSGTLKLTFTNGAVTEAEIVSNP